LFFTRALRLHSTHTFRFHLPKSSVQREPFRRHRSSHIYRELQEAKFYSPTPPNPPHPRTGQRPHRSYLERIPLFHHWNSKSDPRRPKKKQKKKNKKKLKGTRKIRTYPRDKRLAFPDRRADRQTDRQTHPRDPDIKLTNRDTSIAPHQLLTSDINTSTAAVR
jgi:hypothetical protein